MASILDSDHTLSNSVSGPIRQICRYLTQKLDELSVFMRVFKKQIHKHAFLPPQKSIAKRLGVWPDPSFFSLNSKTNRSGFKTKAGQRLSRRKFIFKIRVKAWIEKLKINDLPAKEIKKLKTWETINSQDKNTCVVNQPVCQVHNALFCFTVLTGHVFKEWPVLFLARFSRNHVLVRRNKYCLKKSYYTQK